MNIIRTFLDRYRGQKADTQPEINLHGHEVATAIHSVYSAVSALRDNVKITFRIRPWYWLPKYILIELKWKSTTHFFFQVQNDLFIHCKGYDDSILVSARHRSGQVYKNDKLAYQQKCCGSRQASDFTIQLIEIFEHRVVDKSGPSNEQTGNRP